MDAKGKKAILSMISFYLDNPDEEKLLTCLNLLRWQLPKRGGDTRPLGSSASRLPGSPIKPASDEFTPAERAFVEEMAKGSLEEGNG